MEQALIQQFPVVRANLENIDPDYIRNIGTSKVFVFPAEYHSVRRACQGLQLKHHHVVVSEVLVPQVKEVIATLPHRENVRVKDQKIIAYLVSDGVGLVLVTACRTFLEDRADIRADLRSVATH